jgi:hypothetical protein
MIGRMLLRNLLAEDPEEALRRYQPHDLIYVVASDSRTASHRRVSGVSDSTRVSFSGLRT